MTKDNLGTWMLNRAGNRVHVGSHRVGHLLSKGFRLAEGERTPKVTEPVAPVAPASPAPPVTEPDPPGGDGEDGGGEDGEVTLEQLAKMSKVEILETAAEFGIELDMTMTKAAMLAVIEEHADE
jgi:hypothetical protein